MSEPTLVVHESIRELEDAYVHEYGLKDTHGLFGFYGSKSNTIHMLSDNLAHRYVYAHEYAHFKQRNRFEAKFSERVASHQGKLVAVALLAFLLGIAYWVILLNFLATVFFSMATIVLCSMLGVSDYWILKSEREAHETALRQIGETK